MFESHKEVIAPLNNKALFIIDKYKDYAKANSTLFPVYTIVVNRISEDCQNSFSYKKKFPSGY